MLSCSCADSSDFWNLLSRGAVPDFVRYQIPRISYNRNMGHQPQHDWFIQAWLDSKEMKDADLRRLTGWSKRKTSDLINGEQRYNRDSLNEAARALEISPWEILLHPADANEIKQLLMVSEKRGLRLAHAAQNIEAKSEKIDNALDVKKVG